MPTRGRLPRDLNNDIFPSVDPEHTPQALETAPGVLGQMPHTPQGMINERRKPLLNRLYTVHAIEAGGTWDTPAFLFTGTVTPTAGGSVSVPLTLPTSPNLKLNRFPGAVNLYLGVHTVSLAPQSAPATVGALEAIYVDPTGYQIHCGLSTSDSASFARVHALSRQSITDTDNPTLGQLVLNLQPGAAAAVAYNYAISLVTAFLLPSNGYAEEHNGGHQRIEFVHYCEHCGHGTHH